MDKFCWTGKLLIALLAVQLMLAPLAGAQQGGLGPSEKPVMENVFFNVVWGSIFGAVLAISVSVIEADRPTAPEDSGTTAFEGATTGGIIGLAAGLFLVATGASYDPAQTLLFTQNTPDPFGNSVAFQPAMPFSFETSPTQAFRITGFRATVLELKF